MPWNTACPDWEARLLAGKPLVPELPLFEAEAAKAVRIFNRLRLPDVIGQPSLAEATGEWFRDIVRALFGSYDAATNTRHIQEVFLLVPKKNGKSTNAAAIMVTAAIMNRRPEAELLLIAPTKEIADISFRQASGMIKADPELAVLFHAQRHIRTITHLTTGAMIQIKAADTDAITGVKATFILIDETHVFASKPRAADVFVELRGALAARPDGFIVQITTQSKVPPAGVFAKELRKAREVRDGKRKLPLLPVLYELPERMMQDQAWKDPANFRLVNPNMGRSVNVAFLTREMDTAEQDGPDQMALFASQHLNVEIGLGLRSDGWAGALLWQGATEKGITFEAILERCEVVVVGVDGGGADDLLGLAVLGRERETRDWLLWGKAWAQKIVLQRRKALAPTLEGFSAAKELTFVDEPGPEVDEIADLVAQIDEAGILAAVGLDPMGIGEVVDALADRGISGNDRVIGVPQGWRLSGAIKTAERKLANRTLRHGGQPILAWNVGNAKAEARGNAIAIDKAAAGSAKIDVLTAAFNAIALMSRNPEAKGRSFWEAATGGASDGIAGAPAGA
jgi:phage terminase large subunit-like protein